MKYKWRFPAPLLIFWCFAQLAVAASSTAGSPPAEATSRESESLSGWPVTQPESEYFEPLPCYVAKSKVDELMTRMNITVDQGCLDEATEVDSDLQNCADSLIARIYKNYQEVIEGPEARRLKPSKEDIDGLDLKKLHLINDLKALRVFNGSRPTGSCSVVSQPFGHLKQVLGALNATEFILPVPGPPTPAAATPMPVIEDTPKTHDPICDQIQTARSNIKNDSIFDLLVHFIYNLPITTKTQVLNFSALYDDIGRFDFSNVTQLVNLANDVKLLNETLSNSPDFVGTAAWTKLNELAFDVIPLALIGENATCHITNAAYQTELTAVDVGLPESAYVFWNQWQKQELEVHPTIEDNQLRFRILKQNQLLFASDTNKNPNYRNRKYHVKPSERYLLVSPKEYLKFKLDLETDWKLVPAGENLNQFRILSGTSDDFMFAHKSETGWGGYRRVLLGRKNCTEHDFIPGADLWSLDCVPRGLAESGNITMRTAAAPMTTAVPSTAHARNATTEILSKTLSERYNQNGSTFDVMYFIYGTPQTTNKSASFSALYNKIRHGVSFTDASQLFQLAETVKRLNESAQACPGFDGSAASTKLSDLVQDLSPLLVMGDKAFCHVINVAYQTELLARDSSWNMPRGVYLFQDQRKKNELRIQQRVRGNKLVFRILQDEYLLFASDTNSNHQTNTSERYILPARIEQVPYEAELDWRILSLPGRVNQFRIVSAKTGDYLFAQKSAQSTVHDDHRRVLLGKKNHFDHNHIPRADLWTLKCGPAQTQLAPEEPTRVTTSTIINETTETSISSTTSLSPISSNPGRTVCDLTKMAHSDPASISEEPFGIVSQYNGTESAFEVLTNSIQGLPTVENKITGFSALYDKSRRSNSLPSLYSLSKFVKLVERVIEDAATCPHFLDDAAWSKLTKLATNLSPLMLIGEKGKPHCYVTNVAYGTQLLSGEHGWPEYAYLYQNQSGKRQLKIYPYIEEGKLVFEIRDNHNRPFSTTNANTDSRDTKYQTGPSERHVLANYYWSRDSEDKWKIVPVSGKVNQFRILSAKTDDFMFAHKSATGYEGYRRVLLGRKGYPDPDHIPNADRWTFKCASGNPETSPASASALRLTTLAQVAQDAQGSPSTMPANSNSSIDLLNPSSSNCDLIKMARLNPTAMSKTLPEIVSQRYNNGSLATFDATRSFIEGLPTAENKVIGFKAFYDTLLHYRSDSMGATLMQLFESIIILNKSAHACAEFVSTSASSKLSDLSMEVSLMMHIGEKAECYVYSYTSEGTELTAAEGSLFCYSSSEEVELTRKLQIYPKIKDGQLVVRILENLKSPFFVCDTTMDFGSIRPGCNILSSRDGTSKIAKMDWRLVPSEDRSDVFRILSATSDDFMFVHSTYSSGCYHLMPLLGKKGYTGYGRNADLWKFECKSANFDIPVEDD